MEALALSCEACGAPLPLRPSAQETRCERCGVIRRQPLAERRALGDALWRVKERWPEVILTRRLAAFHEQQARATRPFLACMIPATLGFVLWIAVSGAPELLSVLPRPASGLVALLVAGSWCATKFAADMYHQPPLTRLVTDTLAACDRCGGPVDFSDLPTAPTACPWCGAAVVPGPALRARSLARLGVAHADAIRQYEAAAAANVAAATDAGVAFGAVGHRRTVAGVSGVILTAGTVALTLVLLVFAGHGGEAERLRWAAGPVLAVWLVGLGCFTWSVAVMVRSARGASGLQRTLGIATLAPGASTRPPLLDEELPRFSPLELKVRWRREELRQPLLVACGWVLYVSDMDGTTTTGGWILVSAFGAVTIGWLAVAVLGRWNTATIRLDPDHLRVTHGPMPWPGAVVRTRDLLDIVSTSIEVQGKDGPLSSTSLVARARDGGTTDLAWMFADVSDLQRAAGELSQKLRDVLPGHAMGHNVADVC